MSLLEHTPLAETPWCATTPKRVLRDDDHGALKSVSSALDVLECFAMDGELGVSDIARRLGVAKSTAHRLLQTLCTRGFVEQDGYTGQYRLGVHLYELGQLAQARHTLRFAAMPTLITVAATTGLTVNFSVPDGPDVVFLERLEATSGIPFLGHVGRRLPAHCTSSGKAMAAFNHGAYAARVAAGFPPRVGRVVRNEADWERLIAKVRHDGYAQSHGESFAGASSLAVPVITRKHAVAAISLFGPTELVQPKIDRLLPVLIAGARRIALAIPA